MAINKIIWRDEELAPITDGQGGQDFSPRYNITDRSGRMVAENAKINLLNPVTVQGTRHDAENMNCLVQKCDAQGSFYYRPMAQAPLYNFPHAAQASSWTALPPCPVDMGTNPICFEHKGKYFVTLGHIAEYDGLTYNIAMLDPATMAWDVKIYDNHKPVSLGKIEDFGIFGGKLFVAGKDWDNIAPATAWLDELDLDDLSWTFGTTVTWPSNFRTIGPVALADEGTRAIAAARDGVDVFGQVIDRFTATDKEPTPIALLPLMNGAGPPVPSAVVRFNNLHVLTMPIRLIYQSANQTNWTNTNTHPAIANGHLLPVGADADYVVFVATQDGSSNFYRMDKEFKVTSHNMSCMLNKRSVVRGGSRYFHMRSAQTNAWEPTTQWSVFDAATGITTALPPAPEVLTDYGLAATPSTVFAAKGGTAYLGHFGTVASGVVLGTVFKGLSVSATRDVFLVNSHRTIAAGANTWHKADDDYLICASPEMAVFGQIINI